MVLSNRWIPLETIQHKSNQLIIISMDKHKSKASFTMDGNAIVSCL